MARKKSHKSIWISGVIIAIAFIGVFLYFATRNAEPNFNACGDGFCRSGENINNCPDDCLSHEAICGDGYCDATYENNEPRTCPQDCQMENVCGDHICENGETTSSCPMDCHSPTLFCGDTICSPSRNEDKYSCPIDCGLPLPICGNGICQIFHYSPDLPPYSNAIIDEHDTCLQDCGGNVIPPAQQDNAQLIYSLSQKQRPLTGGLAFKIPKLHGWAMCSIGLIFNKAGTNYLLTAGHCVENGEEQYPSDSDIGKVVKQGEEDIGKVYKIDSNGGVDVSLIKIYSNIDAQSNYLFTDVSVDSWGEIYDGEEVMKLGFRSGITYGTITACRNCGGGGAKSQGADGTWYELFEVTGENGQFGISGDSGSLIITKDSPHKILGVMSACSGNTCVSNYPEDIKSKMGL